MIKPSLGLIGVCSTAVAMLSATVLAVNVQAAPQVPKPISVTATDDTFVGTGLTTAVGTSPALLIGGPMQAVTYLKFDLTLLPPGDGALSAHLKLVPMRVQGSDPSSVLSVHSVADTTWSERTLTAADAPALGPVVATGKLGAKSLTLSFDVSPAVARTGNLALAITTTPGSPQSLFLSKEGGALLGGPQLVVRRSASGPTPPPPTGDCQTGPKLVPTCGVMLGVAAGAHTSTDRATALADFEASVGQDQDIYHGYHRGQKQLFPTSTEISIARAPGHHHVLFLNWRPTASWASIAAGNPSVDAFIDREAAYLKSHFTEPFFFTVHHEPENDVVERPGSGYTAADYAQMYRHVILRLRADGVTNLVTVMDYMAYAPWNTKPWFDQLYPGDDVVDWIGWDMYGYSTPGGYGYGDFAEMLTRGASAANDWDGIYAWAAARFPDKPFMVAEWGVWYSSANAGHQASVFASVATDLQRFPQIKALVYFSTPSDPGSKRDSLVTASQASLLAYRAMSNLSMFQVRVAQ